MSPAQLSFRGYLEGIIEAEAIVRFAHSVRGGNIEDPKSFQKWSRNLAG